MIKLLYTHAYREFIRKKVENSPLVYTIDRNTNAYTIKKIDIFSPKKFPLVQNHHFPPLFKDVEEDDVTRRDTVDSMNR